jgi:hypothetical protein
VSVSESDSEDSNLLQILTLFCATEGLTISQNGIYIPIYPNKSEDYDGDGDGYEYDAKLSLSLSLSTYPTRK